MPFALVIIGLILIVSGARNTYAQLGQQLIKDFTGPGNFTYWLVAIGVLGAIGYAPKFRSVSHMLLALTLIAMVLKNKGIFDKFVDAIKSGPVAPNATPKQAANYSPTAANSNDAASSATSSAVISALPELAMAFV